MKKETNAKEKKSEKSAKNKLPAGTPSSTKEGAGYGVRSTTDPAVPNRAHTEI